jgi:D-alanyl-D-alanine carboxypeptidase
MIGVVAGLARRVLEPLMAVGVAGVLSLAAQTAEAATERYAGIVVDVKTGRTLYQDNADDLRYPASLTKMMTLYLLFEDLERGRVRLNTRITFSANAAAEPPSKLGVRAGGSITVQTAILALVTRSANDVATAIAEHLSGSETAFATRMTETARAIGMSRTTFKNAHGLPNSAQVTTARDMATLGRALMDRFPDYFEYFSTPSFRYNGVTIRNHNNLLGRVSGVNGIKTGYTRASGYNLVTSVSRNGRQIVAVVLGGRSSSSRDSHMVDLINRYLPQASNGTRTAPLLVASLPNTPGNPFAVPLSQIPLPRSRPETEEVAPEAVLVAAAAPTPLSPQAAPAAAPAPAAVAAAQPSPPAAVSTAPAAPAPAAMAYVDPLAELFAQGDGGLQDAIAVVAAASPGAAPPAPPAPAAASTISPDAWKIQIGALPSEDQATQTLDRARQAAPQLLASLTPYTEPVPRNGETLYRARFAGFIDQTAAQAACAALVKEDFACLAVR